MRAANAGGQPNASASSASKRGQSPAIASCSSRAATARGFAAVESGISPAKGGALRGGDDAAAVRRVGLEEQRRLFDRRRRALEQRVDQPTVAGCFDARLGAARQRSETRSVDRRTAIARQRQRDLDLFAFDQPRHQRGVEIGAACDGARLRRFAVGRRRESKAGQRDRLGERDQRRLAAHRLDGGERVGRCRIGREPAREGRAGRFVRFAERGDRRGEDGLAARRGGGQGEEAIGGDAQPQLAVGGTRAGGQSVEKRQADRRKIRIHASRFLLRRRNFIQTSRISLTKY